MLGGGYRPGVGSSIFDLDLRSLGGLPTRGAGLAPLTTIDTASNAIFPLTDITAEPSQVATAKNTETTIQIYQDTLTKMYREVTAQRESIHKSDELIHKLTQVQNNNKKILAENMATVKKYSAGLVHIVTKNTQSPDTSTARGGKGGGGGGGGGGKNGKGGGSSEEKEDQEHEGGSHEQQGDKEGQQHEGQQGDKEGQDQQKGEDEGQQQQKGQDKDQDQEKFMQKLAQLKKMTLDRGSRGSRYF